MLLTGKAPWLIHLVALFIQDVIIVKSIKVGKPVHRDSSTSECAEKEYFISAKAEFNSHTLLFYVTYTGPSGITWDNFDTCVGTADAAGTPAESRAVQCSEENKLVRVLRRTDTAGNNEIMGAGYCCDLPSLGVSAATERCLVIGPVTWVVGDGGASCDGACGARGETCVEDRFGSLATWPASEAEFLGIASAAGLSCTYTHIPIIQHIQEVRS
jgi:hypothetical protein